MNDADRYAPPKAQLAEKPRDRQLYSPNQAAVATFVGGPLVAIYMLRANYVRLDQRRAARDTLIFGAIFMILLLMLEPYAFTAPATIASNSGSTDLK